MLKTLAASAAVLVVSAPAAAQVVDGNLDTGFYGAPTAHVTYDANAPESNFYYDPNVPGSADPTAFSDASSYDIYLRAGAGAVYGYIKSDRAGVGPYANLYFDLDPAVNDGSDLGFEINNDRAFIPGKPGYAEGLTGLHFAVSSDGLGIEFSLDNSLFSSAIPGLSYYPKEDGSAQQFPQTGDAVRLQLSQSFGYSVAGGFAGYGANRLGVVTLQPNAGAVPELGTWAMMIAGFGLVGASVRRRRTTVAFA